MCSPAESAIERSPPDDIEVMDAAVLPVHAVGPVGNHLPEVSLSDYGKGEIYVRPLILTVDSGRPGDCQAGDAAIGTCGRRRRALTSGASTGAGTPDKGRGREAVPRALGSGG